MEKNQLNKVSEYLYWLFAILIVIIYIKGFFWGDDARIIFQVVENLYHGFGPVYTEGERFQVHTSVLWTYYLLALRFFTPNFKLIILLSAVIPLGLIITWIRINYRYYSFLLLIVLFLSNVLFGYWGSGLGNPLIYILLTILFFAFVKEKVKLFIFIAALLLANRLDAVTFVVPLSVFFILKNSFKQNLINFIKFGWPFYLNFLWSFIYFGSLVPNTYYAKVASVDISMKERIVTFIRYHLTIIYHSPLDFLFLLSPFILFFIFRKEIIGSRRLKVLLSSIACFLIQFYIFWIGCDHLNPRLLGTPMLLSFFVIIEFYAPLIHQELKNSGQSIVVPAMITLVILISIANFSTLLPLKKLDLMENKDSVMRAALYKELTLHDTKDFFVVDAQLVNAKNRIVKRQDIDYLTRPKTAQHFVSLVAEAGTILKVGSNVHMVDVMGIADPLMSRIKTTKEHYFPGHNYRPIPRGYPETLIEGTNKILHPQIAAYYERIKNVISGEIFSVSRFKDIFYLMSHEFPIDPNNPECAQYFLSQEEYEQIFKEDYGVQKKITQFGDEEFNFYSLGGNKVKGFKSNYWEASQLSTKVVNLNTENREIKIFNEHIEEVLTYYGPNLKLRPGKYTFKIDYISSSNVEKEVGQWSIFINIGNKKISLQNGMILGTLEDSGKVSGEFIIEGKHDMAALDLRTYVYSDVDLRILGVELTKLGE